MHNLRRQIEVTETRHGRMLPLRRAYNSLLKGGVDPAERFVQDEVAPNRFAAAMGIGRTHHRETESPTASSAASRNAPWLDNQPISRTITNEDYDVSVAQRAREIAAEAQDTGLIVTGKRKRKTRYNLTAYLENEDDDDNYGHIEESTTAPQVKRKQHEVIKADIGLDKLEQLVRSGAPHGKYMTFKTKYDLQRDPRYVMQNGEWIPQWFAESDDSDSDSESDSDSDTAKSSKRRRKRGKRRRKSGKRRKKKSKR